MSTTFSGTYSPEDNKLRLYASSRLDPELYARVRAAGFAWAPKQDLFVAPAWSPSREDLLLELCGEIEDEDRSLVERAEERAERFEGYQEARGRDAESARRAVASIADGIPFGQPILVGHHSERHARKDAERIENGMRRAVKMWQTSEYWEQRAAGAIRHAKYKERPDVRARRIKGLEAELRKVERSITGAEGSIRRWGMLGTLRRKPAEDGTPREPLTLHEQARLLANTCGVSVCFPLSDYPRALPASQYEGMMGLWSALGNTPEEAIISPERAQAIAVECNERSKAHAERWRAHLENRLTYERAMLAGQGGTVADKTGPEKGGAVRCWAGPRGGWAYIKKVNRVTVTVLDNWGNGGRNFTRTVPFDKLHGVMTAAEVQALRDRGALRETEDKTGFLVIEPTEPEPPPPTGDAKPTSEVSVSEHQPEPDNVCPDGPACPDETCQEERAKLTSFTRATFEEIATALKAGVQVVAAPQLFPTPAHLAERMVHLARLPLAARVLEPSAGTGAILRALPDTAEVVAVERHPALARSLANSFPLVDVREADFLAWSEVAALQSFDAVVMNPPFERAVDVDHIEHALSFVRPGGRLVALCAGGPRQAAMLGPIVKKHGGTWEELPPGTFAGTGVRAVLLALTRGGDDASR